MKTHFYLLVVAGALLFVTSFLYFRPGKPMEAVIVPPGASDEETWFRITRPENRKLVIELTDLAISTFDQVTLRSKTGGSLAFGLWMFKVGKNEKLACAILPVQ